MLFTSQSAVVFYDKLLTELDFTLPGAETGRRGFQKEAMVCAFIAMKCDGFSLITDLADYLDNNRLIAHYCGFNIMKPLPSYWTYDRFLKKLDNGKLKNIMAQKVKNHELGIVDASFIGLDSTPLRQTQSRTIQNPSPETSSNQKIIRKPPQTALWVFILHPTSIMSDVMRSTGVTKTMCWWTTFLACLFMS